MARHRRHRTGLFVRRSRYVALLRRYAELLDEHRTLEIDHQDVLEDHEGLLYDLEGPGVPAPVHVPSWARTEPIPVITQVGLDPVKAQALTRRTGLLRRPGGAWESPGPGTTG